MDGKRFHPPMEADTGNLSQENNAFSVISIKQLQHLIRLLDSSDVSELELRCDVEGTRLVLRKIQAPESSDDLVEAQFVPSASSDAPEVEPEETEHKVVAPLVGTFHIWVKPKGGALVAVGDHVKAGQLVGTIESLNVLNEVESSVAGRVVEIFVQDGQPVEYGQLLMTIDSSAEE
jgi:acetyl-CoA carboxylase biotin carboxyl carrier protein